MEQTTPTWWFKWEQSGIILLADTQVAEALEYFKSQDFFVVDSRTLLEGITLSETIKGSLRTDCDILLLSASMVTEADIQIIKDVVDLKSTRLVLFGENLLLHQFKTVI